MTNEELIDQLTKRVPPPEHPDPVCGKSLHGSFGPSIELPDDYRLFLNVYGPGSFTEAGYPTWEIYDLISPARLELPSKDAWENKVHLLQQTASESHYDFPETFPPAYPTIPGLLPWGDFDQGAVFYWMVDGRPNHWRVMVYCEGGIESYDGSMLEFLVLNLTAMDGDKFFNDGVERFTGFQPLSQREEFFRNYHTGPEA